MSKGEFHGSDLRPQFSGRENGGCWNEVTLAHVTLDPSAHLGLEPGLIVCQNMT